MARCRRYIVVIIVATWAGTALSFSSLEGPPFVPRNTKACSIRDSWALIVLGDLHLEDDMTSHWQARDDCLDALRACSLLPSPQQPKQDEDEDHLKHPTYHWIQIRRMFMWRQCHGR